MRQILFAVVGWIGLAAFLLPTPCARGRQLDAPTVDTVAQEALRVWDVPGVAIAIVSPDRTLWLKGYGRRDLAGNLPMTPETVFSLASCSKAFTTTLAAMLVDEGKLAWDDPVRKHLPDFHLADPLADANVTLRDLFTHRTGLGNNDFLWYHAPWPVAEVVRRTCMMPLAKPFRTAFQYQSAMYAAAGLATARAGGDTWESLVQRRIFDPLGMKSARCTIPPANATTDRATPYRAGPDGKLRPVSWYDQTEPNPAGSVCASVRDLAPWLQFHLGEGTFAGRRLVSASALGETHSPQMVIRMDDAIRAANPDTVQISYGLAWVVQDYRGHKMLCHGGVIDGMRAHLTLLPRDGLALAILSNRHQTRLNLALSNTLVDRLLNLPTRDWNDYFKRLEQRADAANKEARRDRDKLREPGQKLPRPAVSYLGEYDHPAYGRAEIDLVNGKLVWRWSTFRCEMTHHHGDVFELDDEVLEDPLVQFQVDANGAVTGMEFLNLLFTRSRLRHD